MTIERNARFPLEATGPGTNATDQASQAASRTQLKQMPIANLIPDPTNPRKHNRPQIRAIARSITVFGFNAPILIDRNKQIVAGHGRYEAAKLLNLTEVPVISLEHLSKDRARAYMLADNKLTDRSGWDDTKVAVHLKELSELVLDFDIEAIGFELPELDLRIQSLDQSDTADIADEFESVTGIATSIAGDLWLLGDHRLYCGSALDLTAYETLFKTEKATAVFTDPPYNVRIDGHVCGNGSIKHREFAMAAGEMSESEFTDFLTQALALACDHTNDGGIVYSCMDWRHMTEMLTAGRMLGLDPLYVDTTIQRWERVTGQRARHIGGDTFAQLQAIRGIS
jgi:ParB-like nuclease domain